MISNNKCQTQNKYIGWWLISGCVFIMIMVVVGGITRLTHSGLSMVKWDLFGSLPPMNEEKWNQLFADYQQSPEYRLINSGYTLSEFKNIFWWEFIHRMIGRTIGIVFIVPFVWFSVKRQINRRLLGQLAIIFSLGLAQGIIGWFMVKSGLNKVPHVSHYFLALHLITAFTTFAWTFHVALGVLRPATMNSDTRPFIRRLLHVQLVVTGVQIIYGGFVAGLKAGWLFPTYPLMGNKWIAPDATSMQPFWENFIANGAGVQFIHRTLALSVLVSATVLTILSRKENIRVRRSIQVLLSVVVMQFILGISTLLFHVPLVLASAHQVVAFVLLGTSVFALHVATRGSQLHDGISHDHQPGEVRNNNKTKPRANGIAAFTHEGNGISHSKREEQPESAGEKKHKVRLKAQISTTLRVNNMTWIIYAN